MSPVTVTRSDREQRIDETRGLGDQARAILGILARRADNLESASAAEERECGTGAPVLRHWASEAASCFDSAFLALREEGLI